MKHFTHQSMHEINAHLKEVFAQQEAGFVYSFMVLNPDLVSNAYAGKEVILNETTFVYRGYKSWTDLAQIHFSKMKTPVIVDEQFVCLSFELLQIKDSFHLSTLVHEEKYGTNSEFSKIDKNEEPAFLVHYLKALQSVKVNEKKRILNLGINSGSEFELIKKTVEGYNSVELVGIDFCKSAIECAKEKFPEENVTLYTHDINDLASLYLGKFDLIISIGTLQSTSLDFKKIFMSLVQEYLEPNGAMILGFPNCRWMDGEMIYGAKVPNYAYSELSLLYKDAYYCKKYLQQKKFRVTLTGKDYIFLTATSIRK